MEKDCPFCKSVASGKSFACENGFSALYNIAPITQGHSLLITNKHAASLFDLSDDEVSAFFAFARKVTSFICHVYACDAWDWSLQEGEPAGQSIEHLHLHIIPRKQGDLDGEEWYPRLQMSADPANRERFILSEEIYQNELQKLSDLWKSEKDSNKE